MARKKERDLTPEEALTQARQALEPLWHRSKPLIAGVRCEGVPGAQLFPLEPSVATRDWLVAVCDPTDLGADAFLLHLQDLFKKYGSLQISFLLVLTPPFPYWSQDRRPAENLIKERHISFAVAVDADGALSEALGVRDPRTDLPRLTVISHGQKRLDHGGPGWSEGFENNLHTFLRIADPGLPLAKPREREERAPKGLIRLDLGHGKGLSLQRSEALDVDDEEEKANEHRVAFAQPARFNVNGFRFSLSGNWVQDADRLLVREAEGTLEVETDLEYLSIVAQGLDPGHESIKVAVQGIDRAALPEVAGRDLSYDEVGTASLSVQNPGLYDILAKAGPGRRKVRLVFKVKERQAIAIYGLRARS